MMRFIAVLAMFIGFTTTAYADFNAGMDAYKDKDYHTAFKEFKVLAHQGNADAQFMMGYMYASGEGVPEDYTLAHAWFNLSAARGNDRAAKAREKIEEVMTPEQISAAQNLARRWKPREAETSETTGLTKNELIRAVQENLAALGYDPGPADGMMGAKTRNAIGDYQRQAGLTVNGEPSQALLNHLQAAKHEKLKKTKSAGKLSGTPATDHAAGSAAAPEGQTQEVISELKKIVKKGEQQRRADARFLAELKGLIRKYDWPWPDRLFHDDFTDGDFTSNPMWSPASGDFWVDSSHVLITRFSAPRKERGSAGTGEQEDAGPRIFKSILKEFVKEKGDEPGSAPQPEMAEIYSAVTISNAFCMDIELQMLSAGNGASLDITPYTGRQRNEGYLLSYVGGPTPTIELARQTYRGSSVIHVSKSGSLLSDGRDHVIRWLRYSDGKMVVAIDGKTIIETLDRTFQDPFDGISIINHNGDYAFARIDIYGKKK